MRTCTSQLCPERGGSVLGKREGGVGCGGETEQEPAEEEKVRGGRRRTGPADC